MPNPAVHTRTIEIPIEAFEELEAYADATGTSVDAAIAAAIEDFVDIRVVALLGEKEAADA